MIDETTETQAFLILRARIQELEAELEEYRLRVVRETIGSRQAKLAAENARRELKSALGRAADDEAELSLLRALLEKSAKEGAGQVEEEGTSAADAIYAALRAQTEDLREYLGRAATTAQKARQEMKAG